MTIERECCEKALDIITKRATYWLKSGDYERAAGYACSAEMLTEALNGHWEVLCQYATYTEED